MNSAINTKARGVVSDYSPERRHAINRIQEKVTGGDLCLVFWQEGVDRLETKKILKAVPCSQCIEVCVNLTKNNQGFAQCEHNTNSPLNRFCRSLYKMRQGINRYLFKTFDIFLFFFYLRNNVSFHLQFHNRSFKGWLHGLSVFVLGIPLQPNRQNKCWHRTFL